MSQSADDGDADASPPAADAAASRRRHRHRPRYEQLGAPTLLHRHVPSYTFDANNDHIIPPKPQWEAKAPLEIAQARSQKLEQRRHAQAQSFVADRERLGRAKMRHHAGAMLQLAGRYDEEHYRELNQSQSQSQSQLQPSIVTATKRRRRRDEALPEYCAPFGNDLVAWGVEDDQQQRLLVGSTEEGGMPKSRLKYYGLARNEAEEELIVPSICRKVPPSPADYGNCLLVLPCCCPSCKSSQKKPGEEEEGENDSHNCRGWFVVHPSGDRLDAIAVTRIELPRLASSGGKQNKKKVEVPIGERILQAVQCGMNKGWNDGEDGTNGRILLLRTQSRCLMVKCSWIDSSESSADTQGCCGGHLSLSIATSLDYFGNRSRQQGVHGFAPIHVAASPYSTGTSTYAPAVFAILSHSTLPTSMERHGTLSESSAEPKQNVVHRVISNGNNYHSRRSEEPSIQLHTIDKLCFISQVEFTRSHPMVLCASGRSSVMHKPGLYHHGKAAKMMKRPLSGRGTNLYSVDLRSNDATVVFNPSHAERMVDGLHSISAVLPDQCRQHRVFVQSISAGSKVWEIDDRMPGKSLCSWSLPGLCDDWGVAGRRGGLHGWGTLLSQPVASVGRYGSAAESDTHDLPLLGLSKSYGTSHLGIYQRPEVYPRFCTQSFEASCHNASSGSSGFALGSSFPLPDVSENIFNCGVAAFKTSIGSFLKTTDIDTTLGKDYPGGIHDEALCIISLTSRGDLYGHALIDSYHSRPRIAQSFGAICPGGCAIPVPEKAADEIGDIGEDALSISGGFHWRLCNDFPIQSSGILPQPRSKDDVRPPMTFSRRLISSNTDKRKLSVKKFKPIGLSAEVSELLPLTQYEREKSSDMGNQEQKSTSRTTKKIKFTGSEGTLSHCSDSSLLVAQPGVVNPFSIDTAHTSLSVNTEKACSIISGKAQKDSASDDEESDAEFDEEMEFGQTSLTKFRGDWARGVAIKGKSKAQIAEGLRGPGRRLPMSSYRLAASTGSSDDEQIGSI